MLRLNTIDVVYDGAVLALRGVAIAAAPRRITALLGSNGAGKTTTLKAISGLLHGERGAVTRGSIEWDGERIDRKLPHEVVARGIVQVFEGRRVFPSLTVEENLTVGGHTERRKSRVQDAIEQVYALFPRLQERRNQDAGYLSGGEQQMLAIGRALVSRPKVILLDEPSLGLAPLITEEIFRTVVRLRDELGCTILLVEQNAAAALEVADYAYVLETGRMALEGPGSEVRDSDAVKRLYLGLGGAGLRSAARTAWPRRRRERWLTLAD